MAYISLLTNKMQLTIKKEIMKILRRIRAKRYGVPFRKREWYNSLAHFREEDVNGIIIFDDKGNYIDPPGIGGLVTYRYKKQLYQYRVVGYQNESRYRDWLYDTDYIHPVIEFVRKL